MPSAEFYFRLTSLDCLMDNDYEHFSGCKPLLLFFSSIVHVLTMLFSQCFKVFFLQLMWLYHIKYLNIPILHLIINLNVLVTTKTNNVFIKSIFARVNVTMKHYKLFTSVLSLHDLSCTTTCIDSLVYHFAMSSYFTFNMWLVTILTKVYFNRMVYFRTYTNGLVLIIMSLFDHYHILVNSTMQIVHIAHNSVTTTWSGFNTDYNDNWSIYQISISGNIFSVIFYVILSYVTYTCMFCNMNTTVMLIITLLFKLPTVYLKTSITIESYICFSMITLVLDNVTYCYNILISAITIYLDKPNCKSPPSIDFRHTKLCIKHIPLMMDNNDVKHLVIRVSQLQFSLKNIICLINGAYIFYLNPIIMLNILYLIGTLHRYIHVHCSSKDCLYLSNNLSSVVCTHIDTYNCNKCIGKSKGLLDRKYCSIINKLIMNNPIISYVNLILYDYYLCYNFLCTNSRYYVINQLMYYCHYYYYCHTYYSVTLLYMYINHNILLRYYMNIISWYTITLLSQYFQIFNLYDINPLTTNTYKWTFYNRNVIQYTVMPVLTPFSANLPFMNLCDDDINATLAPHTNNSNIALDNLINDDKIDHTVFADIDPDNNFLSITSLRNSNYFTETQFNKMPYTNSEFSIFNVNIRSSRTNFDSFRHYTNELKHQFSVYTLTETWLKNYNKNLYNLKGYQHIHKLRDNKLGGGVSIYVKDNILYEEKKDLYIDLKGVDSLSIEIPKKEFNTDKDIIITTIYRPPDINIRDFILKLNDFLHKIYQTNKYAFFVGDFNVNTMKAMITSDRYVNEFHNTFLTYFYHPLINKPTRVYKTKSSLLDNMYTNFPNINACGILKTLFSDHYSLFCIAKEKQNNKNNITVTKREFTERNISKFNKILSQVDWKPIYDENKVSRAFLLFQNEFRNTFESCFPMKKVKIKYDNRAPYLTKGLKQSIKNKHLLWQKYEKNPTTENKNNYLQFRNKLTGLLRKSERTYLEGQLDLYHNDMGKAWKVLRSVLNQNTNNRNPSTFKIDDETVTDPYIISNEFNKYFVEIGPKLAENLNTPVDPLSYLDRNCNSIFLPEISENETLRAINSLKNASAGWDQIPTFIAKRSIQHYLKPLTYLINKSIHQGICPDELKVAKVFPVYKSGDKTNISNYRPISVLSFFSKVFEKIVYNHVIDFIDTNNLLSKQQFGFRKNHSTNHAVITLIDRISAALDSGRAVVGCYIDLKKALDTVNHRILINKLQLYGIRGHILDWFRSYLQNRKQYIHIDDTNSNLGSISCGVPQGSILGPLLFILYINDISNISHLMHTILFAYDTTILIESDNVSTALKLMNKELQKLNTWLTANKLSLNISKTHYMVFDRGKEKKDQDSLYLNKILIERVKLTKFLGVIIDEKLTWTHHISYIKNKISKGFGIILRARKFFNKSALLKLYNSFVLPYLIYCVEIWGNASEIHILPIITLQKKIVRAITFSPYLAHTEDLFCRLKIFPFKKLVIHRIGIQMFKYHKGMVPKSVCELFTLKSSIHSYNTRNKDKIRSAYGKHKFMYRNFRFVSVHVWNYLASNIIINTSLADFKNKSKIFIMSNKFNLAFS